MLPDTGAGDWVLGLDTSAAHCAAALLCGDRLVAEAHEPMEKGQAERLMPLLEEVLSRGGIGWQALSAIGVGTGPGNFTGIRIAVAAARGLSLSLGIPAIGVSGFAALAFDARSPLLTSLGARRGQIWLATEPAHPALPEPVLTTPEALPQSLRGSGLDATGEGAEAIAAWTGGRARPAPPLTTAIARIAKARRLTPQPRPAPLYLRPADAAPPSDPPPRIIA